MRVSIMSTSAVDVPPRAYGGTERLLADLAEGLVERGHDVVVYATGRSSTAGQLRWHFDEPIWPPDPDSELEHATWAWRDIAGGDFDVVHINAPEALLAPDRDIEIPTVMTMHNDRCGSIMDVIRRAPPAHLVAISKRQAELVPEIACSAVIHHGLATRLYPAGAGDGDHVAFLGRLSPEKAAHLAIEAALAAGVRLRIGGPRRPTPHGSDPYFDKVLGPSIERAGGDVEWLGELDHGRKLELLHGARALLVPLEWEEPFGLVMIEAMLVGTPVISFARGSAPEIVEPGLTGFLVRDAAGMASAIPEAMRLDRSACRARALERWSADRMAAEYERLYQMIARLQRAA
jgi:glycosyltransferase involved in cell wall biosynthesis